MRQKIGNNINNTFYNEYKELYMCAIGWLKASGANSGRNVKFLKSLARKINKMSDIIVTRLKVPQTDAIC